MLDVIGPERGGKTDFALSVSLADRSGPTRLLALDYNYRGPLRRYLGLGAKISVETFHYSLPTPPPDGPKAPNFLKKAQAVSDSTRPVWQRFKDSLWKALRSPGPIVIDNGTKLHLLCRLALFGYIHKVPQHLYSRRTNEMGTMLNEIRYANRNLIFIHPWKEVWDKAGNPTGRFARAGAFEPIAYEVMATLEATRDPETRQFQVVVRDSTFNDALVGRRFSGTKRTFERVARRLRGE